jgi:hypothetical protein
MQAGTKRQQTGCFIEVAGIRLGFGLTVADPARENPRIFQSHCK